MTKKNFDNEFLREENYRNFLMKPDLKFEISEMLIEARALKGLTQADLAKKAGTKQPSIARVENESILPSLSFLEKLAKAMNTYLVPPKFAFMQNFKSINIDLNIETNTFEKSTGHITYKAYITRPEKHTFQKVEESYDAACSYFN